MSGAIDLFTNEELQQITSLFPLESGILQDIFSKVIRDFYSCEKILIANLQPLTKIKFINYYQQTDFFKGLREDQKQLVYAGMNWKNFYLDLHYGNLSKINFVEAWLDDNNFESANLSEANFSQANSLQRLNLQSANLQQANLRGLIKNKVEGVKLRNADLTAANLENTDLSETDLTGVIFKQAKITGLKLSKQLAFADLSGLDLRGFDLSNTDLSNANLRGVNLTGVNLSNANLSGADLTGAILDNANLMNANIANTNFTNARMDGMKLFPLLKKLDQQQNLKLEELNPEEALAVLKEICVVIRDNKSRNELRNVIINNIFKMGDSVLEVQDEKENQNIKDIKKHFYTRVMNGELFNLNETTITSNAVNTFASMFRVSERKFDLAMPTASQEQFINKIKSLEPLQQQIVMHPGK